MYQRCSRSIIYPSGLHLRFQHVHDVRPEVPNSVDQSLMRTDFPSSGGEKLEPIGGRSIDRSEMRYLPQKNETAVREPPRNSLNFSGLRIGIGATNRFALPYSKSLIELRFRGQHFTTPKRVNYKLLIYKETIGGEGGNRSRHLRY